MTFRVLSFNVWGLPRPAGRDVAARLAAIGARLPDIAADLVACQEVWTEQGRLLLASAGARAGYTHAWHHDPSQRGGGLFVLSKRPLRSIRFTPYSLNGLPQRVRHADYFGGKGFVRFTVDAPGGPLSVLNTHLHARYVETPEHDEYLGHRIAQIVELATASERESGPLLFVGDFNMHPDESEYEVFTGLTGAVDVAASLGKADPTVRAENAYRRARGAVRPERLDYAFVRSSGTGSVRPIDARVAFDESIELGGSEAAYSDHAAIVVDLEVGAPEARGLPRPDAEALALARRLLEEGRARAEQRRRGQRRVAIGAGAVSLAALAGAHRLTATRRGWLRSLTLALPGLGLLVSLAEGLLAELFVPRELRSYDRVLELLDSLA